jgi:hypothetical protein
MARAPQPHPDFPAWARSARATAEDTELLLREMLQVIAMGESVVICPLLLNVLKNTYDQS